MDLIMEAGVALEDQVAIGGAAPTGQAASVVSAEEPVVEGEVRAIGDQLTFAEMQIVSSQ
jgi:hypothetical protein